MKKEQTIQRLNKIGHVGQIIALVVRIFVIISLIGAIVGTITVGVMPDELASIRIDSTAEVQAAPGVSRFIGLDDSTLPTDLFDDVNNAIENAESSDATFEVNRLGMKFEFDSVKEDDDGSVWIFRSQAPIMITKKTVQRPMILAVITMALALVSVWFFGIMCKRLRYSQSPFQTDFIDAMRNFTIALIPWVVMTSLANTIAHNMFSPTIDMQFGLNPGMLLIVVLMFVLVRIFRYGAILQQESDETL